MYLFRLELNVSWARFRDKNNQLKYFSTLDASRFCGCEGKKKS